MWLRMLLGYRGQWVSHFIDCSGNSKECQCVCVFMGIWEDAGEELCSPRLVGGRVGKRNLKQFISWATIDRGGIINKRGRHIRKNVPRWKTSCTKDHGKLECTSLSMTEKYFSDISGHGSHLTSMPIFFFNSNSVVIRKDPNSQVSNKPQILKIGASSWTKF